MKKKNQNMQIIASKKKGSKSVTIHLENELTIFSIEGMKDQIIDTVNKFEDIKIELKNVNNMDLTFVQLLYSIKITAEEQDKKVTFNADISEDIKTLFENSDLSKIIM